MIVVTGATGFVGRHLVAQLLRMGHPVRVLVPPRTVNAYERRQRPWPWAEAGAAEIIPGSIFNAESLFQAVQGVHTIFHLASAQWWGSIRDLEQVDIVGTRQVIAAARSARVGRVYVLSHLGAASSSAFPLLRIKGQVEELLRESGLAYTIFRCGVIFGPEDRFFNNYAMLMRTNPFFILQPGSGEFLLHPLYINDLVKALEISLERIDLVDQVVEIGGGEYVSWEELSRTLMRVSGAGRMVVRIPPYLLRTITNMLNVLFPSWPATRQWFDIIGGNRTANLGNLFNYTGVRPVRFEDTLLTYMPHRNYFWELVRFVFTRHSGWQF
jgi:NADH dehydrogenase